MSSSICPHFAQNAWKKDLCSNCFKSKEEHKQQPASKSASHHHHHKATPNTAVYAKAATADHATSKTDFPNRHKTPAKGIIKGGASSGKTAIAASSRGKSSKASNSQKVTFRKTLFEVIGYGGEWSDGNSDSDSEHDFMSSSSDREDILASTGTDDEETLEMKRVTKANTDFNMNNGNLLGDPQENIKKTFAALKLGAPQVDKEGKKQTLKINVTPFGAASPKVASSVQTQAVSRIKLDEVSEVKKSETTTTTPLATQRSIHSATAASASSTATKATAKSTSPIIIPAAAVAKRIELPPASSDDDGKNSPPIERAMEKSLLEEISETLEQKQSDAKKLQTEKNQTSKIKFEITSLAETLENKPFLDLKKPIARNVPITKDHIKPKVNVFQKYSDSSDSNCSDAENGISAYYDVVESTTSYENLPDGQGLKKNSILQVRSGQDEADDHKKAAPSVFSNSQYITDMLLSSKTRAASYNLHQGDFTTSKITSNGLIVTKCSSDDALDSTGSSFDGSSDEETSYNMTRSESDSGIGISIGNDYKTVSSKERDSIDKKMSVSTNSSDYEDIQVVEPAADQANAVEVQQRSKTSHSVVLEKSRELHGEPDGSADPDGSIEVKKTLLPALPKSPPPTKTAIDARPSFLHGLQKVTPPPVLVKKPNLPVKPVTSIATSSSSSGGGGGAIMKTFVKRQPTHVEQQVINQLQMVITTAAEGADDLKQQQAMLKKGRAPNPPPPEQQKTSPPPTPEKDYSIVVELEHRTRETGSKQPSLVSVSAAASIAQSEAGTTTSSSSSSSSSMTHHSQCLPSGGSDEDCRDEETKLCNTIAANDSSSADVAKTIDNNNSAIQHQQQQQQQQPTSAAANTIYTRKLQMTTAVGIKNTASPPVIREKDKRERATINPKFRSLNTFTSHRNNNNHSSSPNTQLNGIHHKLLLKQPSTPEPSPRNSKNLLSMSQESLSAVAAAAADNTTTPPNKATTTTTTSHTKAKTKFSIKKFLRMGASKTTDNLHKKDGSVYSEICTGEETGVVGKPRLVIIHPIDINPMAVEVVKDITKTNDPVASQTVAVVTSKPPAPPIRTADGQRLHEINKPARPPPPKSAELRRKQQKISFNLNGNAVDAIAAVAAEESGSSSSGSNKSKADNVYANLGEIRSSIAPRKPERTASMREREAQLELARKRSGSLSENTDTISICSSNGDIVLVDHHHNHQLSLDPNGGHSNHHISSSHSNGNGNNSSSMSPTFSSKRPSSASSLASSVDSVQKPITSGNVRINKSAPNDSNNKIANKLEIFENRSSTVSPNHHQLSDSSRPSSLKDSVRKITSTIDSYLKDKRDYENMYEFVKNPGSPPPPPARTIIDVRGGGGGVVSPSNRRAAHFSAGDNASSIISASGSYTRNEFGPSPRTYGLNSSLANIPRVISASYCGSEASEFDIYSPYSYYGSETGGDVATDINDSVWGMPSAIKNRAKATNRLRMRKGRSVVHKTIEDNYTAVVVANHEALAQVLDQLQQTPIIPPALRPLANAMNLRFEDFTILDGGQAFVVGKKAFHAAIWTSAPVTLALSSDCNQLAGAAGELCQLSGGICDVLNPITEFCDLVPSYHLPLMPTTEVRMLQATISVLPRLQLETLQSIGAILKSKSQVLDKTNYNFRGSIPNLSSGLNATSSASAAAAAAAAFSASSSSSLRNVCSVQNLTTLNKEKVDIGDEPSEAQVASATLGMPSYDDVMSREVAFIMLQLVNGLKNLQAIAIEEMPLSLSNVILSKDTDNKDAQARLCVLQGNNNDEDEPMGTLCKCAHIALTEMLPLTKMTPILNDILLQERSESLSKSKSVLEFVLWGPSDVVLSGPTKERELALQRWLDLERATVLHGLVRTRVELTVYDECHLMFLVRSNAKIMNDAAQIVCSYQKE